MPSLSGCLANDALREVTGGRSVKSGIKITRVDSVHSLNSSSTTNINYHSQLSAYLLYSALHEPARICHFCASLAPCSN